MDDDVNDNLDDFEKEYPPILPLDGQIAMDELYLPEVLVEFDDEDFAKPIDNQISFEEIDYYKESEKIYEKLKNQTEQEEQKEKSKQADEKDKIPLKQNANNNLAKQKEQSSAKDLTAQDEDINDNSKNQTQIIDGEDEEVEYIEQQPSLAEQDLQKAVEQEIKRLERRGDFDKDYLEVQDQPTDDESQKAEDEEHNPDYDPEYEQSSMQEESVIEEEVEQDGKKIIKPKSKIDVGYLDGIDIDISTIKYDSYVPSQQTNLVDKEKVTLDKEDENLEGVEGLEDLTPNEDNQNDRQDDGVANENEDASDNSSKPNAGKKSDNAEADSEQEDANLDGEASEEVSEQIVDEEEVTPVDEKVVAAESSDGEVVDGMLYKNMDEVLHESMIPYSEHVILDRALPRVEDGLKPVQRRILFSMLDLGITPDKPFRKSARIVGDCLGKYHPHGDRSVYDAMVRMAQPFNTNGLLVNGHGNFGSVDGDGAAAMRYTEARMAPLAMELLRDLDKNTVKWNLNFDDTLKEPDTLPGRFPNLLVNGATGIAVGLATNIPPHNLGEVIDGVVAFIDSPSIKLKEMLKIIKAPDFPTGGYILSSSEIEQAYRTGRGKIYIRAKVHIETNGVDKRSIVITEMPYQTNKVTILQKIATLREDPKNAVLSGISEIRDESDRNGLRAVIRVKKDADVKKICEFIFKNTDLQVTFGINMVAIAGGKPKQMALLEIIEYYVDYQREVVLRRSKYDLEQAKERAHILTGLIIAIKNIDAVVKIIKTSQNTTIAKQRLRDKFILSERQAQAILDMRLARLTSLEVNKLQEELKALEELIKKLTAIVGSKKLQLQIVKTELLQIKRQYRVDRRSILSRPSEDSKVPADTDEKAVKDGYIAYNALGNIKFINSKYYSMSQREFKENSTLGEVHKFLVKANSAQTAMFFTNLGNCYKMPVNALPESRFKDKGITANSVIKGLLTEEKIVTVFAIGKDMPKKNLLFLTKFGMIKKTSFAEYALLKSAFQAMKLKAGDEIVGIVKEPTDAYSYLFVTNKGMLLKAENKDVPVQGRISGGVKGINLSTDDFCVGVQVVNEEGEVVVVSEKGFAKRMLISKLESMVRYRKGVKAITFTPDTGKKLIYADYVTTPYELVCLDDAGNLHSRSTDLVPIEQRTGKGKLVDKMSKKLFITKVYRYVD